jgi:hypothetical protein
MTTMSRQIASLGAMLALVVSVGSASAKPAKVASCCVNHAASHAKCCDTGKADECCRAEKLAKGDVRVCAITGKPLTQCCGSKASQTPPCCQKGCKHAGKKVR